MRRFNYALVIATALILAAMPAVAQSVVVSNDEWVFADGYINNMNVSGTNDLQFATNSARWMTGGVGGGTIYILVTSEVGATYNSLATLLTNLGYTVIGPTNAVPTQARLSTLKAIYLSSCDASPNCPGLNFNGSGFTGYAAFDAALVTYVQANAGNVFILAGTTCHDADLWNGFLNTFGLTLVDACNGLQGVYAASGNTPGGVRFFSVQQPYGITLFPGVNLVYISNGNNVQSVNPDCGVEIFNDVNGNGLYGAWMPCACDQIGPRRLVSSSVRGSVLPAGAQGRKVRSNLPAPPPANEVYDNGPINGDVNAWTINFGYSVSDSLEILRTSQVSGISFGAWLYPGDSIQTVEVQIGSSALGYNFLDEIVGVTQSNCVTNACGYAVCTENLAFTPTLLWAVCPFPFGQCSGTYWVTLQNATVPSGDPAYWDENYGAGCGGFQGANPSTCPSSAFESPAIGVIPSEAFTLQ